MGIRALRAIPVALALAAVTVGQPANATPRSDDPVPVDKTVDYRMPMPLLGNILVNVRTSAEITKPTRAGGELRVTNLRQSITLPPNVVLAMHQVGAATMEISGGPGLVVDNAGTALPIPCGQATFPSTPVPPTGQSFTLTAALTCQPVVLPNAGPSKVALVDAFDATVTPRRADGSVTPLGTFTSPSTLEPGADPVLLAFDVPAGPREDPVHHVYTLTGNATVKKLNNGPYPIGPGTLDAARDTTTGAYTGTLTLPPTRGQWQTGPLPVAAEIVFVQDGALTGTLAQDSLSANGKVTLKFPKIWVAGREFGGPDCRTSTPADLVLTTAPGFDILRGGKATGTYTIPPLVDCGEYTGQLSAMFDGPDNAVAVDVTPKR
ncbi:DUF6801 domain-containing protein [Herbihabitans rhizosphaerae]|nr:DUF6801 domain-containing protein [Herbihabitans rhizosphaerae]